jgi:hypothetical protein
MSIPTSPIEGKRNELIAGFELGHPMRRREFIMLFGAPPADIEGESGTCLAAPSSP